MWYIINFVRRLFNKLAKKPVFKRKALSFRYAVLPNKALVFTFFMLMPFIGGYLYDHYFARTNKEQKSNDVQLSKKIFTKMSLIILVLIINFFMNELHLFCYLPSERLTMIPNNPTFFMFMLFVGGLTIGLLTYDKFSAALPSPALDSIDYFLLSIMGLVTISNFLSLPRIRKFLMFIVFGAIATAISLKYQGQPQNVLKKNWLFYALLTFLMENNIQYVVNMQVSKIWSIIHYGIYALQLAYVYRSVIQMDTPVFF